MSAIDHEDEPLLDFLRGFPFQSSVWTNPSEPLHERMIRLESGGRVARVQVEQSGRILWEVAPARTGSHEPGCVSASEPDAGADGYDMIGDDTPVEQLRAEWTGADSLDHSLAVAEEVIGPGEVITQETSSGSGTGCGSGRGATLRLWCTPSMVSWLPSPTPSTRTRTNLAANAAELIGALGLDREVIDRSGEPVGNAILRVVRGLDPGYLRARVEQLVEELRYTAITCGPSVITGMIGPETGRKDILDAEPFLERLGGIFGSRPEPAEPQPTEHPITMGDL